MARRGQPTARQVRLGAELKRLRQRADIAAGDAARQIGMDQAKLTHLEAGRAAASETTIRSMATHYDVADATLVDALVQMATARSRGWWDAYKDLLPRGFLDLAELEHHATFMRTVEVTQVPGLLQTEDHARAVFQNGLSSDLPQPALDARIAHRMERRRVFDREQPTPFETVLHEAALRIRVAGRGVARDQLEALIEASEQDHITIRVIPFDIDNFATAGYAMFYLGTPVPQLDTVQLDNVHGGVFLDEEAQLLKHRGFYERVRDRSLEPEASRAFVHRLFKES